MQVPLQFEFQGNQTFDSYFAGSNAELVGHLQALASERREQQIYLWGEAGSGKTHLLQACCQMARMAGKDPFYLALPAVDPPPPAMLEGLECMDLVCVDDLQHLEGQGEWQQALFHFYNRHRQHDRQLLLAAACPPKFLPFGLADLKTRMGWGLTLKIQALDDAQLIDALAHKARHLGFDMPPAVGRFLLTHYVRDLPALWQLLEKIDRATLAAKHRLTIPFLKKILAGEL